MRVHASPLVLILSLAACEGGPEPARPQPPPPAAGESGSVFLSSAVMLCRESCAPRDALWSASEVAGSTHLRCSCPPLSTLPPARVKRIGPKVSSTSSKARGVEAPVGAYSQPVHDGPGAVAVEGRRAGLHSLGGPL